MSGAPVILVDDEPDLLASTAQALDLEGFAVQEVAEGVRALDLMSFGFPGGVCAHEATQREITRLPVPP